jgi:hypothetical protein
LGGEDVSPVLEDEGLVGLAYEPRLRMVHGQDHIDRAGIEAAMAARALLTVDDVLEVVAHVDRVVRADPLADAALDAAFDDDVGRASPTTKGPGHPDIMIQNPYCVY